MSCDKYVNPRRLLGDFSMRGQQSVESAIKSSAAWCLSFYNTATVPAILWLEDNYNCDCTIGDVAYGAISTEHSVMCSNYAIDAINEYGCIKGGYMSIKRILKCNPFSKGGIDLVKKRSDKK